jgi:signal transduction histidine kinase
MSAWPSPGETLRATEPESSAFDASVDNKPTGRRWLGWRRSSMFMLGLLASLGLFLMAGWLSQTPHVDAEWTAGPGGTLVLASSPQPALQALRGKALISVATADLEPLAVDAWLLHRWPRWQPDGAARARQVAEHEGLAQRLADGKGQLRMNFEGGIAVDAAVLPRGYAGLGWMFWPCAALATTLLLFIAIPALARPDLPNLLLATMGLCHALNLLMAAAAAGSGLGLPRHAQALDLPLRFVLDLCTGAAALHLFARYPLRLPRGLAWSATGWMLALVMAVAAAASWAGDGSWVWVTTQGACFALCLAILTTAWHSHRLRPDPYALVMRRLASASCVLLGAVTAAAVAVSVPSAAASAGLDAAPFVWYAGVGGMLVLAPFMSRGKAVAREFVLLAGVGMVATVLALLFAAVLSLGMVTSMALSLIMGLGLYAGLRPWMLNHPIGSRMQTTERTFDRLYQAAREVHLRPARHPQVLAQLLRELFEPIEVEWVERVPVCARVINNGSALVVPLRSPDTASGAAVPNSAAGAAASAALLLRYAQRGRRLFTPEDARLADRVVEQLRRVVSYDAAFERGRLEERQRIAQDLHDDIGARLLTLMYQAPTPEMEDYIRHTLQDLKTLTRGLAASEHRLTHAAAEWKADLTQRLTVANATLQWSFSCDRDQALSVVQWSALTRLLRELVSNALYHGHAAHIEVTLAVAEDALSLRVADDGSGRAPDAWAAGLGMGGVRKRVKALGGKVSWRERDQRGIVCQVLVPGFRQRR